VKHVLVVNVHFAPNTYGGATIVAEEVSYALLRRGGFRVTAISLCERTDLAPYAVLKTEVAGVVNYLINVPAQRSYAQAYDNPEITARLVALLETLSPDVVHVHCIQDLGTGIFSAAETADIPVILSVHDFWWLCERQFMQRIDQSYCAQGPVRIEACKGCAENYWAAKVRHAHLMAVGARAAAVTYPSKFAKELSETSGFAPGKGEVWENGVQMPGPDFFDLQKKRRANDGRLAFGFLGGPSHIKGWPLIQQAFGRIRRSDFIMRVVDGSLDGTWWRGVDLTGMRGDWQVQPRFSQVQLDHFYAQIDVLLFMSQWKETYGLAIREALVRGIRVIQTDSGGTVEHNGPMDRPHIPIGAPATVLHDVLQETLDHHPSYPLPVNVQSFDGQATELESLLNRVLGCDDCGGMGADV
jgi:glycosyltransferase involved in cell wall biosynthesis